MSSGQASEPASDGESGHWSERWTAQDLFSMLSSLQNALNARHEVMVFAMAYLAGVRFPEYRKYEAGADYDHERHPMDNLQRIDVIKSFSQLGTPSDYVGNVISDHRRKGILYPEFPEQYFGPKLKLFMSIFEAIPGKLHGHGQHVEYLRVVDNPVETVLSYARMTAGLLQGLEHYSELNAGLETAVAQEEEEQGEQAEAYQRAINAADETLIVLGEFFKSIYPHINFDHVLEFDMPEEDRGASR